MNKLIVVSALSMAFASLANAAVPTTVTDAITSGGTDAVTVAAAVFVALIGVFAVKLMRKGL